MGLNSERSLTQALYADRLDQNQAASNKRGRGGDCTGTTLCSHYNIQEVHDCRTKEYLPLTDSGQTGHIPIANASLLPSHKLLPLTHSKLLILLVL